VSLLEIYNEQIKDLVESHDLKGDLKKLDVKNDPNGGTYVNELTTRQVECIEDVLQVTCVCVCVCVLSNASRMCCTLYVQLCVLSVFSCVCVCLCIHTHTHTHAPGDERGDAQPLNEQHQHELSEQPEPLHLLRPCHLHRCHYGE
jgi:hypothetical protein